MINDIQLTKVYLPTNVLAKYFTIPDIVSKYSRQIITTTQRRGSKYCVTKLSIIFV